MEFTSEFLHNAVFRDSPLKYDPMALERKGDGPNGEGLGQTGAIVRENGDILFRIYAPNASEVRVNIGTNIAESTGIERERILKKNTDGVFEDVYPYNPAYTGPHSVDVWIDGTLVLYPYIPITWMRDRPVNYIEVPDPETEYIQVRDVPHGAISREVYWSRALGRWQRCLVYTPPGYQATQERYPVLYLQHGATEDEICWEYNGRIGYIMDNLLAEGKCVPFLIVMNDGMARSEEDLKPGAYKFRGFEDGLTQSCIPFIDSTYRTLPDREYRALAGLSMGASMALHFGMHHPELFASLGMFSAPLHFRGNQPEVVALLEDKDYVARNYHLILRTVGDAETMQYTNFLKDEERLKATGTALLPIYFSRVYHNQNHEWGCWRRAVHDFAQLVFRKE